MKKCDNCGKDLRGCTCEHNQINKTKSNDIGENKDDKQIKPQVNVENIPRIRK